MLGGGAIMGAAAIGGLLVPDYRGALRSLVEDLVRRHLPGVRIDDAGLSQFSAQKLAQLDHNSNYRIYAACRLIGLDVSSLSDGMRDKIDTFERETVSDFLLGSNFFWISDRTAEDVVYHGDASGACQNPFAVFD